MRSIIFYLALWALCITYGCGNEAVLSTGHATAQGGAGISVASLMAEKPGAVLLFLAPECPLCQNYAPVLRDMAPDYAEMDVPLVGVVSGTYYSAEEVNNFMFFHHLDFPVLLDPGFELSRHFGATITPEAVLIDSTGAMIYRGAIDNWAISLGRKRLRPTAHYLADATDAYLKGKPVPLRTTDAVGCFIE